jgi:hypothetical protein
VSAADDQRAAEESERLRTAVMGQAKEIDRLRAELAETRAAGDALAEAVNDLLDDLGSPTTRPMHRAEQAEETWRSVRGDAPTAGGLLPDKRILIDLTPPSRAIPADQRRKLAAELRSRFVDGPVDEWSAGWLSAAGYIGSDSPIGTDAGTDLAAPAVAPTEPPAVGLPVTLSSPDDVAAIEPDGFVDGATTRGDDVRRVGRPSDEAGTSDRIVTEYRLSASKPSGRPYESTTTSASVASNFVTVCRKIGWTDARVESRTVSTSRRESEWKATDR